MLGPINTAPAQIASLLRRRFPAPAASCVAESFQMLDEVPMQAKILLCAFDIAELQFDPYGRAEREDFGSDLLV